MLDDQIQVSKDFIKLRFHHCLMLLFRQNTANFLYLKQEIFNFTVSQMAINPLKDKVRAANSKQLIVSLSDVNWDQPLRDASNNLVGLISRNDSSVQQEHLVKLYELVII